MPEIIGPNDPALDSSLITALFPGEVVTRAFVRDVDLPYGAGTMALITLDNGRDHTRPNTFGPAGLISLRDALEEVAARAMPEAGEQRIAAVGVTGKPFIFSVGADLTGAPLIGSREEALAIGRLGHAVFRRLGELGVPSFAFVNGAALGGGLELALHCSYRTISSGVTAVGLPECFLGLLPGWGGTYLLPHLIGPARCAEGHHREPAQPEPHAARLAGLLARDRRRDVHPGRLPGRVPPLGRPRGERHGERSAGAAARRLEYGELGPGGRRGAALRGRQAARRCARALPGHRPGGRGPRPDPRRGVRRRGRRARATCCSARNCGPGSTPST